MDADNYASSANGCRIASCSPSPNRGPSASPDILWVPWGPSPQSIILDLSALKKRPDCFNVLGIESEAGGPCNPKVIEVEASSDGHHYSQAGVFSLKSQKGWQMATLPKDIPARVKFVKLTVLENYGGERTVFKVFLGRQPEKHHRKNQTEVDVLRLLQERVSFLEEDGRLLRDKVKQQAAALTQLQETVAVLVNSLDIMRNMLQQGSASQTPAMTLSSLPNTPNRTALKLDLHDLLRQSPSPERLKTLITFDTRKPQVEAAPELQPPRSRPTLKQTPTVSSNSDLSAYVQRDRVHHSEKPHNSRPRKKVAHLMEQLQNKLKIREKLKKQLRDDQPDRYE